MLYLLRHGKSSWAEPTLADRDRPLSLRGRRDAKRIATHLVRQGVKPELVLCSTAERTRETLELMHTALADTSTIEFEDELYGASANSLLERLRLVPGAVASVMMIGHNPGLQDLALVLAAGGAELERLEAKFPTAALATLALENATWAELSPAEAVLADWVIPKQLGSRAR
jgi:phosphohistidine phosphatase